MFITCMRVVGPVLEARACVNKGEGRMEMRNEGGRRMQMYLKDSR